MGGSCGSDTNIFDTEKVGVPALGHWLQLSLPVLALDSWSERWNSNPLVLRLFLCSRGRQRRCQT